MSVCVMEVLSKWVLPRQQLAQRPRMIVKCGKICEVVSGGEKLLDGRVVSGCDTKRLLLLVSELSQHYSSCCFKGMGPGEDLRLPIDLQIYPSRHQPTHFPSPGVVQTGPWCRGSGVRTYLVWRHRTAGHHIDLVSCSHWRHSGKI